MPSPPPPSFSTKDFGFETLFLRNQRCCLDCPRCLELSKDVPHTLLRRGLRERFKLTVSHDKKREKRRPRRRHDFGGGALERHVGTCRSTFFWVGQGV